MAKLPKSLTKVTGFSKALALLLILAFITVAFYAGMMFQQKYTEVAATITPTPTPIVAGQTSCNTDSDCTLTTSEVSCCPNTKCLRYSDPQIIAVSSTWLKTERISICGVRVMCPMYAVMCTREITEENAHYSAKCIQHICTKVRS